MNALRIYQEYKFKKGESEFYISEGQVLKVNTISGDIYKQGENIYDVINHGKNSW